MIFLGILGLQGISITLKYLGMLQVISKSLKYLEVFWTVPKYFFYSKVYHNITFSKSIKIIQNFGKLHWE